MTGKPKILIVDDLPQNLFALEQTLKMLEVEVIRADSGKQALYLVLEHQFALAIVDVQMPEMDGYEFVELLRSNAATSKLPVIFVSAIFSDEYHHRKGYEAGAVDFMSKPFVPEILLSKVKVFVELFEKQHELQSLVDDLKLANVALARRTLLLETSAEIGQQVTSILDLQQLLVQVTKIIQTRFNYSWVSIWLETEDKNSLTLEARTKSTAELGILLPVSHRGLIGQVCRMGNLVLDNNAGKNSSFVPSPGLPVVFSEVALPLKFPNILLGVLDIQSERLQAFSAEDLSALQLLSSQIAVAVRNARLYAQVQRLSAAA